MKNQNREQALSKPCDDVGSQLPCFEALNVEADAGTEVVVTVIRADLSCEEHQRAVLTMTAAYAQDEMGNGGPLPDEMLANLIGGLREHPTTLIFLAFANERPVGIATCFLGFSTFAARPLINIHDLAVLPAYRGRGVGRSLLDAVESEGRQRGCVKLTLEVQENNARARDLYDSFGFAQAVYGDTTGGSLFYSKRL